MAQLRHVAAVQEEAAGALWNLAAGSEALRQRLANAGAVEALLQAMAEHRDVPAVQEEAAVALPPAPRPCSSGSPMQKPWRPCSRPWPSTETWPPCRRGPLGRCGIWLPAPRP